MLSNNYLNLRILRHISKLLDDVVGNSFTCLLFGLPDEIENVFLEQKIGDCTEISWLWVTPKNVIPQDNSIIPKVRDVSGAVEKAMTGFTDSALLLRPDHYVAALIPRKDLENPDCFQNIFRLILSK